MTAEPVADAAPDIHTTVGKLAELRDRVEQSLHPGTEAALEKRHAKGQRTARERIEAFMDPGSFTETDALARHRARDFGMEAKRPIGDGVITGYGTVERGTAQVRPAGEVGIGHVTYATAL